MIPDDKIWFAITHIVVMCVMLVCALRIHECFGQFHHRLNSTIIIAVLYVILLTYGVGAIVTCSNFGWAFYRDSYGGILGAIVILSSFLGSLISWAYQIVTVR